MIECFKGKLDILKSILERYPQLIDDWSEPKIVIPYVPQMIDALDAIAISLLDYQTPLLMQPIWKTLGKTPKLAENCLDVFIWSNLAFTRLFINLAKSELKTSGDFRNIARHTRTIIWLFKMISDFSAHNAFNHRKIIDHLSYNTKNDKAFAVSGRVTQGYMRSPFLSRPRITQSEIKNIILGGGQNLLSPERRFDAIVYNSPNLFD